VPELKTKKELFISEDIKTLLQQDIWDYVYENELTMQEMFLNKL
jgi:hypothetical protein